MMGVVGMKTFSYGRTERAQTIFIMKDGKIVDKMSRKHVVFFDGFDRVRGHLRDGRPVVFRDGKWIYEIV